MSPLGSQPSSSTTPTPTPVPISESSLAWEALHGLLPTPLPAPPGNITALTHLSPCLLCPVALPVTAQGWPQALLRVVGGSCCSSIILKLI